MGGPGAIGTTVFKGFSGPPELVGVVADVAVPAEPVADFGESPSLFEFLADDGVVTAGWATEFFRLMPFLDLDEPTGIELPLPRLRFLITSVFKLSGRTTPCSFRNSPHALQSG